MYFYMILAMISFESFVMEPEPDFLSTFPSKMLGSGLTKSTLPFFTKKNFYCTLIISSPNFLTLLLYKLFFLIE